MAHAEGVGTVWGGGSLGVVVQVNERLRAAMRARRVTFGELSGAVGLTTSSLRRRMAGRTAWRLEELEAAAAVLGVDLVDLVRVAA